MKSGGSPGNRADHGYSAARGDGRYLVDRYGVPRYFSIMESVSIDCELLHAFESRNKDAGFLVLRSQRISELSAVR